MFMNLPAINAPSANMDSYAGANPSATETIPWQKSTNLSKVAVVLLKSGKEIHSEGEESILELAEIEGVRIRNSCRSGVCGSCKKRKLEGEVRVEVEPEGLSESEHQEGYILTCISYPIGRVVIDA
jgi:glycine betaine catabolism B